MIEAGKFHNLRVDRAVDFGVYLTNEQMDAVLLPKRFVPEGLSIGDELRVFVYHDSENRPIATTQQPLAVVGEIARLKVVAVTPQGAFLDFGLMKDLFVPRSKQLMGMRVGGEYIVALYIDEQTGRLAATEKVDPLLSNENITVKPLEIVKLMAYRKTDLGFIMIINHRHTGLLHFNEVYRNIRIGDLYEGFIKNINEDNTIDLVIGKPGYQRVDSESDKILKLLDEHNGYLPYHDKSAPEEIYEVFSMSKKTFKMTIGKLFRERKVELTKTGIKKTTD